MTLGLYPGLSSAELWQRSLGQGLIANTPVSIVHLAASEELVSK